ncbi:ER membrane protein complex subunit 4-like [Corticium candelabrum]|uniref:ER membrane protein complex subunit 4-like n=1 Tax=Corticium candelabrum TaxID=121492 RepID=UPI002E272F5F|nr:ER membrane protein complex subunit 4-like [Corticium candelabrum]
MASKGVRKHRWSLDFTSKRPDERISGSPPPDPVGYAERDRGRLPREEEKGEEHDTLVEKKSWDVAIGPLKQLPMNLFIMYMVGNSLSIIPIMFIGMMAFNPIKTLLNFGQVSKQFEGNQAFIQKLVFVVANIALICLAAYKCHSMGLLPLYKSDWVDFLDIRKRMEYTAGGILFGS